MSMIKDSTMQEIVEQIGRKNAILLKFINQYTPTTWLAIQANVRAGKAKALYAVGDELICNYTFNGVAYQCPWVVVDNDRKCEWEDGTLHDGLWLSMKYATPESIQFDHPEETTVDTATETTAQDGWYYWGKTGTTYTALNLSTGDTIPTSGYDSIVKCGINDVNVLKFGYNRWSHSAYRQWLNSGDEFGEWWTAQHLGDVAPNELNTYKGFMAGLDSDFRSVVTPIKVKTSCNTVTDGGVTDTTVDTFFLPSVEEVYGVPQIADIEGPYFPYWKQVTGFNVPDNGANNGRKIFALNAKTSARTCRLRSAYRGNSNTAWYVYTSGGLDGNYAYNAYRCAPACVIS